jgi:hypothetical protein
MTDFLMWSGMFYLPCYGSGEIARTLMVIAEATGGGTPAFLV